MSCLMTLNSISMHQTWGLSRPGLLSTFLLEYIKVRVKLIPHPSSQCILSS